jgi:phytoene dehydrogenase-like protein
MSEDNLKDDWDFIIVGAGICGLSLGALLVNDGYNVLILEKAKKTGGRAKVVEKNGFTMDYGMHTVRFGRKSALAKTLETIREKGQEKFEFTEFGRSYYFLEKYGDPKWTVAPTGLKGITKGTYLGPMKLKNVIFRLLMAKKKKNLGISVEEWQDKRKFNEQGTLFLRYVTSSLQVCPFLERASMGELRRNLGEVIRKRISATYPIGGWKLIFDRLLEKITKGNGQILTKKKVDEVILEDNQAKGVKCEDQIFNCKKVVIATPVQEIFNFLDESVYDPEFVNLCKNLRPTAGLSIDFALKEKISEDSGLFFIDNPFAFGYFTSNLDKGCAPENKQLLTFCSIFNVEDLDDPDYGGELLMNLRQKLFFAFPGLEENIEFERPLFTIFDGAEVNINQYQELRPGFKVPGIDNLYLVGDSTAGEGAGGDIGHNSVWDTYNLIKANLK